MRIIVVVNGLQIDISNYIATISWSGDKNQMARKLSFSYLYTEDNVGIQMITLELGCRILVYDDLNRLIFDGICVGRDRKETDIKMTISAVDYAWYLKSKVFGVYEGTPQQVAMQVLQANGIMAGELLVSVAVVKVISTGDKSIYDVIRTAYEAAGCDPYIYMQSVNVCVGGFGAQICGTVTGDDFVTDASYKDSAENLVDRVAILDKDDKLIGAIDNAEDVARFGVIQEGYKASDDTTDIMAEAQKLFKGIENSGSITVRGDTAFVTGQSIIVGKVNTAICGKFCITSDNHFISNGIHTVSLTLDFEGVVS